MIQVSDIISEKLNALPDKPGIYKFLDSNGRIIYIGKSICLSRRVKSYFVNNPKWDKVKKMISFIENLEFIVTDTHLEARLLECELIKSIKPIFNSQMKNDERYAYIKIEEYNTHNPISVVYKREANSFGPFRRKFTLYKTIDSLKNVYPIRKIEEKYDFNYNLFPLSMDRFTYEENKSNLLYIFTNENSLELFIQEIEIKMKEAASLYKFETASIFRDIILSLNYLRNGINGYKNMFFKNIFLKLQIHNGYKLFFIYNGQILFKKCYKNPSKKSIDLFIKKGLILSKSTLPIPNEKISIDFRDILYSEIISLPKEFVQIIN